MPGALCASYHDPMNLATAIGIRVYASGMRAEGMTHGYTSIFRKKILVEGILEAMEMQRICLNGTREKKTS